jgi:hypothetical protein
LQRIARQSKAKQRSAEQRIALHGIAMQSSAEQRIALHSIAKHRKAMRGVICIVAHLCRKRHLSSLSAPPVASRFRYRVKPEVLVKRARAHCCERVGRQALIGTGAGARGFSAGIPQHAGGAGVAVTASETRKNFSGRPKRFPLTDQM